MGDILVKNGRCKYSWLKYLGSVWFGCFLFSFSLKIENGDENVFDWIFVFIFNENIFPNEPKTGNNKISFSVEIGTSFWVK